MFQWVKLSHLAQWTGARVTGPLSDFTVASITTDSRAIARGEVFLALRGEKFDGHEFIHGAVEQGAAAIISELPLDLSVPVLQVPDSLKALIAIGEKLRSHFSGIVIAVTGSAGKSSTKEMLATLLGPSTVRAPASFNNLIGVSKTLMLLEDDTRHLVLEIGMNALGEIREICDHFSPRAGLITNIGTAHIGKLGGQRNIYKAKKELFDALATTDQMLGVALNLDDPLIVEAYRESFPTKIPTVTYSSEGKDADVTILEKGLDGASGFLFLRARVRHRPLECHIPIFGVHQAENIAAAMAGALVVGVPLEEFQPRLAEVRAASHRGEVIRLAQGKVLIDESYNSNPTALISSLTSLAGMEPDRRRVLVLGEMREMGEYSDKLHAEAGEALAALHAKCPFPFILVGVGSATQPLIEAVRRYLPTAETCLVSNVEVAQTVVATRLMPRDIIFVKGSRGIRLDALVTKLAAGTEGKPI